MPSRYRPGLQRQLDALQSELEEQLRTLARDVYYPRMVRVIEALYEETYGNWEGGGDSQLTMGPGTSMPKAKPAPQVAKPVTQVEPPDIVVADGRISMTIRTFASDGGGNPHWLYFALDFGTGPRQQGRTAVFPVRSFLRYKEQGGQLNKTGDFNFTNRVGVAEAGQVIAGMPEMRMTEDIANEFRQRLLSDPQLRGWVLTSFNRTNIT